MESIVSTGASIVWVMFLLLFGLLLYLLPTFIAFNRQHPYRVLLLWINLFLGWSGIVWLVLLIWAIVAQVDDDGPRGPDKPLGPRPPRPQKRSVQDPMSDRRHPLV